MWMQYSSEFLALALVHFLAVLLPGPDFAITVALLHKGLKDRVILSNSILSDNLGVRSA